MPASAYLTGPVDYDTYGVPLANPANVLRASQLIDHYLHRPEGCIWVPDANGVPAYMASKTPSISYTLTTPIFAGDVVNVAIPEYAGDNDSLIGEMVVIDRLNPLIVETCVVQSVQTGQVTLTAVQFDHPGTPVATTLEFGLATTEERGMPNQRSITRLSQWPVARLLSGIGRYAYGRRTDQMLGYFYDANLLSTLSAFGGPPAWTVFPIPASSLNPETGDLWVPAGQLLSYYTDIKIRYVSGWSAASLPWAIKTACGMIVKALEAAPMGPQIRRFGSGKLTTERFADTVLDRDIKQTLQPYVALWMV